MEELKTLDEIKPRLKGLAGAEFEYFKQEIKKELGIKWIKKLKSELCTDVEYCNHCMEIQCSIEILMKIFNIPEKDLK